MTYPPCPVMEIGVCNFVFPLFLLKFKSLTALNELLFIIKCFHSMEVDPTFQEKNNKKKLNGCSIQQNTKLVSTISLSIRIPPTGFLFRAFFSNFGNTSLA